MKIRRVTPWLVSVPTSEGRPGRQYVFVQVETDEGITGWGEAGGNAGGTAQSVRSALLELAPELIGRNAGDVEPIWHFIYRRYTYFGSRGFGTAVAAGVDIALWDIKGQAAGVPVYELLGGQFRERIALYSNSWFAGAGSTPEGYAAKARELLLPLGHTACKLDPFFEMRPYHRNFQSGEISQAGEQLGYDVVAAVREAVGPAFEILIDAHGHYNVPTAIRLANTLYEQSRIGWFEEPVPPESIDALRTVREHTSARISVGERLRTRWDFLPVLQERLTDYVMPDTIWTGGISEAKRIAQLAELYNVPVSPHCVPMGPLEIVSAAHVVSSIPNFYRLEHSHPLIEVHNRLLTEPYRVEEGHLILNGKPGLGYALNEEWLRAHDAGA
jgi:galactonate dehydratase